MGLKSVIKSTDIFGHPVNLTFKGSATHNTFIGGVISILVRVGLLGYILWRLQDIDLELKNILDIAGNSGGIYYIV